MLTPADIDRIEFTPTRVKAGYDQDEVDNFLDRAQTALHEAQTNSERLQAEIVRLKSHVAQQTSKLDALNQAPTQQIPQYLGDVSRILAVAQQTADQELAAAEAKAAEVIRTADIQARQMIDQSAIEADANRQRAESAAYATEQRLAALKDTESRTRKFLVDNLDALRQGLEGNQQ